MNKLIQAVVEEILGSGLRVFIDVSESHGLFTNDDGFSVVSFELNLGGIDFSGNYKTSKPKQCGSGWPMGDYPRDYPRMIQATPPNWATCGATWRHTTLAEYLSKYDDSSIYREIKGMK